MAEHILDSFRYPSIDVRHLGSKTEHAQLIHESIRLLDEIRRTTDVVVRSEQLNQLKGNILALETLQYYSQDEAIEIVTKINNAEKQ